MQKFITDRMPEIEELCRAHHVQRMSIFGSAVRDDFDPATSDVDVRVLFESSKIDHYAKNAFDFHEALAKLFGRRVDMISGKRIKNVRLARRIEETETMLYAA